VRKGSIDILKKPMDRVKNRTATDGNGNTKKIAIKIIEQEISKKESL